MRHFSLLTIAEPSRGTLFRLLAAALVAAPLAACSDQGLVASSSDGEHAESVDDSLYVNTGISYWTANQSTVPVCWATTGFETEKRWTREAVENTWGKYSNLRFTGWEACPTSGAQRFVRMDVTRLAANAGYSGTADHPWGTAQLHLPSEATTVHLRFQPNPTLGPVQYIAVHEFGHVLGFVHEQERPDNRTPTGELCSDTATPYPNGTYETQYDLDSIMNYCSWRRNSAAPATLSASDIVGLQRIYGRKAPGSIVSFDGRCLDVKDGVDADWTVVQTYTCFSAGNVASRNQRWTYDIARRRFNWVGSSRALDLKYGNTANGTPIQLFRDIGGSAQTWTLPNAQIQGLGKMCIDLRDFGKNGETQTWLWECNGLANQSWTIMTDGTIRLTAAPFTGERCLDLVGGSTANGAAVRTTACNGSSSQKWTLGPMNTIRPAGAAASKCLEVGIGDVRMFDGVNGKWGIQLWDCNGRLNQQFNLSSEIRNLGNSCLDVYDFQRRDGAGVDIWSCNALANQRWDFYW